MQLFEAGDDGVWFYIIEKGQLEASVISLNGRELTLAILLIYILPGYHIRFVFLRSHHLMHAARLFRGNPLSLLSFNVIDIFIS